MKFLWLRWKGRSFEIAQTLHLSPLCWFIYMKGLGGRLIVQLYRCVLHCRELFSLLAQEWDQKSEKGSGLQLPAAAVTTAGVDPAGAGAEGIQQEPPPDENKVRK